MLMKSKHGEVNTFTNTPNQEAPFGHQKQGFQRGLFSWMTSMYDAVLNLATLFNTASYMDFFTFRAIFVLQYAFMYTQSLKEE